MSNTYNGSRLISISGRFVHVCSWWDRRQDWRFPSCVVARALWLWLHHTAPCWLFRGGCTLHSNPVAYICGSWSVVGMSHRDKSVTAIHKCRIQIQSQAYLFSNLKNIFTNTRLFIQILYLFVCHIFIFVYLYLYIYKCMHIYKYHFDIYKLIWDNPTPIE